MKSYVVHVSDPTGFDEQAVVTVNEGSTLGEAVHMMLDELAEKCGGKFSFPVFVDIHPSINFATQSWMYSVKPPEGVLVGRN